MASPSNGAVFRVERHENFTIMSNIHLQDSNLSFKARGLLSTILSFPPTWNYTLAGLATCARDSLSSTKSGVIELEENGYLMIDCQFHTDHLESMGGVRIGYDEYMRLLEKGLKVT